MRAVAEELVGGNFDRAAFAFTANCSGISHNLDASWPVLIGHGRRRRCGRAGRVADGRGHAAPGRVGAGAPFETTRAACPAPGHRAENPALDMFVFIARSITLYL
jgi:hypothetical protein